MEQTDRNTAIIWLLVALVLIIVGGGLASVFILRPLGVPSAFRPPLVFFLSFLAIYPFVIKVSNNPDKTPVTFGRWMVHGLIASIVILAVNILVDSYM